MIAYTSNIFLGCQYPALSPATAEPVSIVVARAKAFSMTIMGGGHMQLVYFHWFERAGLWIVL